MTTEQINDFKPGIYRHYKGRYYQALFLAQLADGGATLVIFVPLYSEPRLEGLRVRARTL